MSKLKQYYEESGYQVGKKEYIDNPVVRDMLLPVVRLLLCKRKEAIEKNNEQAEEIYRQLYLEISLDAGITMAALKQLNESE